ncbi:protein TSSC4 [Aethina tumida]|uniref:protein TSSC4 n=1 Tax=Aethina tumida TaxID=116153 RepID=UPI002148AA94|nr:protein TSSC4 [Aethina tumida]
MVDGHQPFSLNSGDSQFKERQKNVFTQLDFLETSRTTRGTQTPSEDMEVDQKPADKKLYRRATKQFRGKESIFKKPQNPAPKNYINKIPDFKKNPHKWTKYSLDDVRDEDISDRSNTRAALSFLNDLKSRRSIENADNEQAESDRPAKVLFNSSRLEKPEKQPDEEKPSFRSSKLVMPEYVVGQKMKKDKKNASIKKTKIKELKLDHLMDDDDDQESI